MKHISIKLKKNFFISFLSAIILLISSSAQAMPDIKIGYSLLSPDKNTKMEIGQDTNGDLLYRTFYQKNIINTWSKMGFVIDGKIAGEHSVINQKIISIYRGSFAWRLGEDDSISNNYNQLIVSCADNKLHFNLIIRAYNGSVAFRYQIPSQPQFNNGSITKELTTFVFNKALTIYQYNQESIFVPVSLDSLKKSCDLPATLTDYKNTYISIGEADNENYTKVELTKGIEDNSLQVSFMHDTSVHTIANYKTPWRTISYANTANGKAINRKSNTGLDKAWKTNTNTIKHPKWI